MSELFDDLPRTEPKRRASKPAEPEIKGSPPPAGTFSERIIPTAVGERIVSYEQCAREKYDLPAGWSSYGWEVKGGDRSRPGGYDFIVVKGAVAPLKAKAKGPRDFDWKKRDKSTDIPLTIPKRDWLAWLDRWEKETGHCHECNGSGRDWAGWSAGYGNYYRPCKRCNATGVAPASPRIAGEIADK